MFFFCLKEKRKLVIPGRKERVPSASNPFDWDCSPSIWPIKMKNERNRRSDPNNRRNTARAIDFHGILSKAIGL